MQEKYTAEDLLKIIACGEFEFVEGSADSGGLTITLVGLCRAESESLIDALQNRHAISCKNEDFYSRLIETVKTHPLYKPRNPSLAILQVAKDNGVSADSLKRAMSEGF